jgi:hypothetical protein
MSESTAPQTALNVETASVQEPIEVVGGSTPVSFDEMEAVTNWKSRITKNEPEVKTANRRKEEGDDLDEVLSAKAEKTEKADKPEKKEAKAEKSDKEEKSAKNTQAEPQKALKFKVGDKEVELAASAVVPVKVNGKVTDVPIQEVINRYSQQKHLDDIYRTYKTEKAQFDTERQKISDVISKSYEMLSQKKDLRGFVEYMSEALGVDGQKLYSDAVEQIRQAFEEESTLTPEERRLKQLESENQFYRQRVESERTAKTEAAKTKALETQVDQIIQTHGMDKATFVKAYDELVQTGIEAAKVTPEMVGKYYANTKIISKIESRLSDINPDAATEQNIEKLATLAIQTGASEQEIEEVIQQLYANEAEKKLAKKINKTLKAKASEGPKRAGSDPLFFDDLAF